MRNLCLSLGLLAAGALASELLPPVPLSFPEQRNVTYFAYYSNANVVYARDWIRVLQRDPFWTKVVSYADSNEIEYSPYLLRFVGNNMGFLAPFIQLPDSSIVIFGSRHASRKGDKSVPYIVKLDKDFKMLWERYPTKSGHGFTTYEGGAGALCPDGKTYVMMLAPYEYPGNPPIDWIAWMDEQGRILRDFVLPGHGTEETPLPQSYLMTDKCGLQMEGDIPLTKTELRNDITHDWYARYSSRGILLIDSVGNSTDE